MVNFHNDLQKLQGENCFGGTQCHGTPVRQHHTLPRNSACSHWKNTCEILFDAPCNCASFGAYGVFIPCKLRTYQRNNCVNSCANMFPYQFGHLADPHLRKSHRKNMNRIPFDSPCNSASKNIRLVNYPCDLALQWSRNSSRNVLLGAAVAMCPLLSRNFYQSCKSCGKNLKLTQPT